MLELLKVRWARFVHSADIFDEVPGYDRSGRALRTSPPLNLLSSGRASAPAGL